MTKLSDAWTKAYISTSSQDHSNVEIKKNFWEINVVKMSKRLFFKKQHKKKRKTKQNLRWPGNRKRSQYWLRQCYCAKWQTWETQWFRPLHAFFPCSCQGQWARGREGTALLPSPSGPLRRAHCCPPHTATWTESVICSCLTARETRKGSLACVSEG